MFILVHYICGGVRVVLIALEGLLVPGHYNVLGHSDGTELSIISCRSYKNSTIMP